MHYVFACQNSVTDHFATIGGGAGNLVGDTDTNVGNAIFGTIAGGFTEGDFRKMFESQTPLGRIGQPDDIAPAAIFFASDDSKWITGETLLIAGGLR